jgi:hypothetical protein
LAADEPRAFKASFAHVWVTSISSTVGSLVAWVFYPLLGGGAALFVTAALMAYESGMILRAAFIDAIELSAVVLL